MQHLLSIAALMKRITISLSDTLRAALHAHSKKSGVPISETMRRASVQFLVKEDKDKTKSTKRP